MVDDPNAVADKSLEEPSNADLLTDDDLGDELEAEEVEAADERSRVTPSLRPGVLTRMWERICAPFARLKLPPWNLRTFAWLLLGLIVLTFLISNWSPMRFYMFGRGIELPKSVAIIVLLGVGFLGGWLARAPKPEEDE